MRLIEPQYRSFGILTSWDDKDGNYWAKELAVHINDMSQKPRMLPWATDKRAVGEEFYIVACSPSFAKNPNSEVDNEDLRKALVMEKFSEDEIVSKLKEKIDSIGKVSLEEFEKKFEQYFNMSDWRS